MKTTTKWVEELKEYLKNKSDEDILKDWDSVKMYDEVGMPVKEFLISPNFPLPSAEEYLRINVEPMIYPSRYDVWEKKIPKFIYIAMVDFAKLHVIKALRAASQNAKLTCDGKETDANRFDSNEYIDISEQSIYDSYTLDNIQ